MEFIPKYSNRMVGLMTESEFVRHMPCEECGSSDGNSLYSDGHTYCFVCHNRTGDNDVIHNRNVSKTVHLTGSAERLHKRNISEKTNQFYQIYRDGNTLRFPYHDESGVLKGVKIKLSKKISDMKEFPLTLYLGSIGFLIAVNVLLLLKAN